MANAPDVTTRKVSRDQLATFLKSHELIKAFENLTKDVSTILPSAISDVGTSADSAMQAAVLAIEAAACAHAEADRLAALLAQLEAATSVQRTNGADIQRLQQKIDQLDTTINALQRNANTDALRNQIEELRTILLGG